MVAPGLLILPGFLVGTEVRAHTAVVHCPLRSVTENQGLSGWMGVGEAAREPWSPEGRIE